MKILEEIRNEVEKKMKTICGKCVQKRYTKLTPQTKKILIYMIIVLGKTIKKSSEELGLNYHSAKAFVDGVVKYQNYNTLQKTARVSSNKLYSWKNFVVETYCQNQRTNQYTMESYATFSNVN